MILEEETFKEFGYHSNDLAPKSDKRIVAICNDCGKIREICKKSYRDFCLSCVNKKTPPRLGKHHSEETKKKMSDAHKGEKHPNFGKHLSRETREKISKANRGQNKGGTLSEETKEKISKTNKENPSRLGKHHTEEAKKKMSDAQKGERNHNFGKRLSKETRRKIGIKRKARKFPTHHTKPELIFEQICKRNNLDFHYVGDGSLWIGKKEDRQLNPDFIEANGKKTIVEIFGDWWHSPLLNRGMKEYATLEYRKRHYKQFGWKSIFLWESDLLRKDADTFVLMELKKGGVV